MPGARSRVILVGGAMLIAPLLSGCGLFTSSDGQAQRVHRKAPAPPKRSPARPARSLRVPRPQAGELARATVTRKGQTDVVRRLAGARRYAVRVACIARGPDVKAAYAVYDTDTRSASPRELTSGGFPCDGSVYVNSVGRVDRGVQIALSRLPRHVIAGYAIVVPE